MFLVVSCDCLHPIHRSQVLSRYEDVVGAAPTGDAPTTFEWSTIYCLLSATYIRGFVVVLDRSRWRHLQDLYARLLFIAQDVVIRIEWLKIFHCFELVHVEIVQTLQHLIADVLLIHSYIFYCRLAKVDTTWYKMSISIIGRQWLGVERTPKTLSEPMMAKHTDAYIRHSASTA